MNKIDIIIDVLEIAANEVESAYVASHIDEALAAARELKALKPVAFSYVSNFYKSHGEKVFIDSPDKILMAKNLKYALTPLYALEVTK
jgi:hypothetical protein